MTLALLLCACTLPAHAQQSPWTITFPGTVTADGRTITPTPTSAQGFSSVTATYTITYTYTAIGPPPQTVNVLETPSAGWQAIIAHNAPAPSASSSDSLGDTEVDSNSVIGNPPTNDVYQGNCTGTWAKQLMLSGRVATDTVTLTAAFQNGGRGNVSVSISASAQPLAIPKNFRLVNCVKDGDGTGTLVSYYTWDSSDGKPTDLKGCYIHEYVVYPGPVGTATNPINYYPPSPPYSGSDKFHNPTQSPGSGGGTGWPAENNTDFPPDNQLYEPANSNLPLNQVFIKPYQNVSFTATQYFEYDDTRSGQNNIVICGPIYISRSVYQDTGSGNWFYKISKGMFSSSPLQLP